MSYSFLPGRIYRMPTHFGPLVGPRQGPDGERFDWSECEVDAVTVHYRSNKEAIERLLPPRFELYREPIVTVGLTFMRNVPWLAGRGYNTLGFRCPVQYNGSKGSVIGSFLFVLWENKADPILTGRDELGFSKIFCDLPPLRRTAKALHCEASWEGFRFLELKIEDLQTAETAAGLDPSPDTGGEIMHYRYLPRTGEWGTADIEQVTSASHIAQPGEGSVLSVLTGKPQLSFNLPRWEDMPSQYQVIHGLESLPRLEMLSGYAMTTRGIRADLYHQRVVE